MENEDNAINLIGDRIRRVERRRIVGMKHVQRYVQEEEKIE